MDASNLVQLLQHEFHSAGIDICNGFSVAEYNKLVKFQLPTFSRRDPLGVVIGSTKVFWPHFIQWLSSLPSIPKDPIDNFYRHTVERVIKALDIPGLQYEIRYDWDRPATGRFVHVQTAGHLAGVAFYDQECMWSCHPEFGLWFVYRAAVVFSVEIDGFVPSVPRQVLTPEIVTAIKSWYDVAVEEKWQNFSTRLKIRDSCPIGRELYRYDGDMLDYFFPIREPASSVLERIRQAIATQKSV
eukprot:TRINITY_DN2078_c0_g1_i4.p2 TRINITY_DN2078_c0_g1~~TRINITY_DN2078_c0_g1_i4.p2  ORF type:complete len:242 (-),score=20.40 TRINITY_DN2078_c0_g1_i4:1103-1828(-)